MHAWLLAVLIAQPLPQQGTTAPAEAARSAKAADETPKAAKDDASALIDDKSVQKLCTSIERTGLVRFQGDAAEQDAARTAHEQGRAQALEQVYRVAVPSKGFAFGHYRAGQNQIELDGDRPLRAANGTLALDLQGIDDVAFPATREQLAQWNQLKKDGKLSLVVAFRPADERCAGSNIAKSWRMAGTPLSWQLVADGGQVLARAVGNEEVPAENGPRSLQVTRVSLDNDPPSDDEGAARLQSAQGSLEKCASGAKGTGPMVVAFAVQGGKVRDAQVIMDGARDPQVSDCVAKALTGATVTGGANGRGTATIAVK